MGLMIRPMVKSPRTIAACILPTGARRAAPARGRRLHKHLVSATFVATLACLSAVSPALAAPAPGTVVTSIADDGEGSLRQAILAADRSGGTVTFDLPAGSSRVIEL